MNNFYYFLVIVPSVILHEVSHGFVANHYGDPTAKERGRLTLNPLVHIDPFGTVLLPLLLVLIHAPAFGYAKPVPVNVSRLRNPRKQSLYVSLAGPLVNIILSLIGLGICFYAVHVSKSVSTYDVGLYIGLPNLVLAAFNLIPIPPLDGSAIIERFVPRSKLSSYYQLRARAMPFVLIFVVLAFWVFNFGNHALYDLEIWWQELAFK